MPFLAARPVLAIALTGSVLLACTSPPKENFADPVDPCLPDPDAGIPEPNGPKSSGADEGAWQLVWSDEFEGPAGAPLDTTKWTAEIGGDGWGNQELQYYTDRIENAALDGQGNLAITALREDYLGSSYTSARITTRGKFEPTFGRMEASLKLPSGIATWPAFWGMGVDPRDLGWPQCGELDVMENIGSMPRTAKGSAHGPGYSGGNSLTAIYELSPGQAFSESLHHFAVEWDKFALRWYVDGNLYSTRTPRDIPPKAQWAFNHAFYLILNLAVGGRMAGNPAPTDPFPQVLLVEYVRFYQR
jgi:beta-glucanase (GH16 family)